MKKLTSLLCALTIMLGANAIQVRQDVAMRAQANDFDFVQAMYMGHAEKYSTGDWYFRVSNGETLLAVFDINTGSENTISGTYQVGTPYASTYYNGNQTVNITGGVLGIKLLGDTLIDAVDENGKATGQKMKLPLYEFTAENLVVGSSTFSMKARAAVLAYDYQYQKEGKDNWLIGLKDEVGKGGNTVELSITGFTGFDDKTNSNPAYWFVAGSTSDSYTFSLVVVSNSITGSFSKVELGDAEDPYSLTYLKKGNSYVALKSGFGNAKYDAQAQTLALDFYLVASDNTMYHISNAGSGENEGDKDPYQYDETTPFSGSFKEGDFKFDTQYFASNKAILLLARNDQGQYLDLIFFVNAIDPATTIPAGVYTVNGTEQPGTMQASQGEIEEGGQYIINQSFAGLLNAAGNAIEKEWLITSGSATVTNVEGKVRIVINATNSKGQPVTAELGAGVTALEDIVVEGQAAKAMYNGQLIIIRNGVRYNAQGAVVE